MATRTTDRPGRSGREAMSLRNRVLVSLIGITAITLFITTLVDFIIDWLDYDEQLAGGLDRSYAQVTELASNGVDPATGAPFASAEALVQLAIERAVSEPGQGFLGVIDGEARWAAPTTVELRVEEDDEFVQRVEEEAASATSTTELTFSTAERTYRVLVVPIAMATNDATDGVDAYVVAFDLSSGRSAIVQQHLVSLLVGALVLALAGLVAWRAFGRVLSPLTAARQTAEEVTASDLSRRIPVEGNDDLALLVGTINAMLDRLEAAFAGQRELLDEVSHELRTPLTIVQGHLELLDEHDPADVAETRALVLDELARMNRLIEDLLLLAKSGRPDFVHRSEVDLAELLDSVMQKVMPLGDRDWQLESRPEAVVRLDPQRITQALLQLAGNSVQFSEPGSRVALGAYIDPATGILRIWVQDAGVGIAPERRQRVFDRFVRADDGSELPTIGGGLGIGLAIVSSIARGHGGTVELESQEGVGSRFTLVLPLRQPVHSGATEPAHPETATNGAAA